MTSLCTECNSLGCTCTNTFCPNDDNDDISDCDNSISEVYSDESYNIIHRSPLYEQRPDINNHSDCKIDNESKSVSSVNLNLKKKGINIGFLNVQGICGKNMSKFSEINLMLTSPVNKNIHIFGMCETKLKERKLSDAFKINGFHAPFRKDNTSNGGGGIIVYVRKELMAKRRVDLEVNNVECLWVEITPKKGKSFLIGNLYRNPAERADWSDRFDSLIDRVLRDKKEIIILGDFNKDLLNINQNREWSDTVTSLGLTQLIQEPTRVTNTTCTLIDHVYTSNEEYISDAHVAQLGLSDHYAIFCNRKINYIIKRNSHKSIKYRSFKNFDENAFLNDLFAVPWSDIETCSNVDDALEAWYSLFIETIDKHAPIKEHRIKHDVQPDWVTSDVLDKIKQRDNLKHQCRFDEYKTLRNEISNLIQERKRSTYESKIEEGKDDPKSIWKIFKEFGASSKKDNDNDILEIKLGDTVISNDFDLAENFNDYFINVASSLKEPLEQSNFDELKQHISEKIPDNVYFELPELDENFVFRFLSTLDVSKATGLDGIGPKLLKLSSGIITKSITYVANKCIRSGQFPNSWKQAKVNPLYKGGANDDINNYRPISILPTLSKLIEKFIQKHLMYYLNSFDILHKLQSGFRTGHSTETALTIMTERWLKAINEGKFVGTIMVDFRKAFDLVDHDLLLQKLTYYKCDSSFITLMRSYLKNRTQVVSVNGKKSNFATISSGVPQGSILGPLLFLIFINDLPLVLSKKVSSIDMYADDTTVYDIQDDLETLRSNLQESLSVLHKWCQQNGMLLNTDKTKVMLISTRQKRIRLDTSLLALTYNDIDLQLTTGDKILGVYIDENFQWNNHFQYVCKKVSSYIWLLSKIKTYLSFEHRSLFYKAYIQPHFNYCNIIWGNSSNYNVSKLTKLQKRACKIILENEYEDLDSARKRLNILSFDQNVFVNKAKIMYKVANSLIPQYIIDLFQLRADSLPDTALRSVTNHNFTIPKPKTSLYKESLSYSGPIIWNAIPADVKTSSTIGLFTNKLRDWLSSDSI